VIYESIFPEFNQGHTTTPQEHLSARVGNKGLMNALAEGYKAKSMLFDIKYNRSIDTSTKESSSAIREGNRSAKSQGVRRDRDICQGELKLSKGDIEEAKRMIDSDGELRLRLARQITTAHTSVYPARFLMSELCRYAYLKCIELGEMLRESFGGRTRRDYSGEESD
jgi:hypothetical protein